MNKQVRVRFAPSPTGHLHIGSLRTALFNWLFARHNNGTFLVRIEDTDVKRSTKEFVTAIYDALDWVSLASDEPVLFQSERLDLYKKYIDKLLDEKKAYRCYCPGDEDRVESDYYKYDGRCRLGKNTPDDNDAPHVVRIAFPLDKPTISFNDRIRGEITFDIDQYDDFIIARSDGMPTYNFVVVVDDALTNISHVIRGEDHIGNTPKQIVLYNALGFSLPEFAHIPLILGSEGQRLSKRDAATSVLDYKKVGYLPDALCNYLVRLGWAHGDQELFTRDELIAFFTLDGVGKKGSIFDQQKLDWVNGMYIRQTVSSELLATIKRDIEPDIQEVLKKWDVAKICALIDVYKQRVTTLRELVDELHILYKKEVHISDEDTEKWLHADARALLKKLIEVLPSVVPFEAGALSLFIKQWCKENEVKIVTVAQPIRLALTGKTSSPGVFDLLAILGQQESLERLQYFLEHS